MVSKLHYFEKGSGPPVVFVHGSNGSLQDFKLSVMDRLSKDFRTVAFDRPGHGHSERGHSTKEGRSIHGAHHDRGLEENGHREAGPGGPFLGRSGLDGHRGQTSPRRSGPLC